MPIIVAYGLEGEASSIEAHIGTDAWDRLRATTIRNLYRFSSGWLPESLKRRDNVPGPTLRYATAVFKALRDGGFANAEPPFLAPGDMRFFLRFTTSDFQELPPGTVYNYSNPAFNAASELLSKRMIGDIRKYTEAMRRWWGLGENQVAQTPASRNDCIDYGEMICGGAPGVSRASMVSTSELLEVMSEDALPPFTPAAYSGGQDLEFWTAGYLTMSAAAMARILQSMHPEGTMYGPPLLTRDEFLELSKRETLPSYSGTENTNGLGLVSSQIEFLSTETSLRLAVQLSKSGGDAGAASKVIYLRFRSIEDEEVDISIAWTAASDVGGIDGGTLVDLVEALERLGYWSQAPDLFPLFPELARP